MGGIELRAAGLVGAPVAEVVTVRLHVLLLTLTDLPDLINDLPGVSRNLWDGVLDVHEIVSKGIVVSGVDLGDGYTVHLVDGIHVTL